MGKRVRSISRALTLLTHHFRDAPDMTRAPLFPNSPFLLIPRTGRFINTVVAAREHERNRGNRARSSPGISGDLHPSILSVHDVDLHRACGVDSVELTAGSTEYVRPIELLSNLRFSLPLPKRGSPLSRWLHGGCAGLVAP